VLLPVVITTIIHGIRTVMTAPLTLPSMKTHIVPAAHGFAFEVKEGERFRIVDLSVFTI